MGPTKGLSEKSLSSSSSSIHIHYNHDPVQALYSLPGRCAQLAIFNWTEVVRVKLQTCLIGGYYNPLAFVVSATFSASPPRPSIGCESQSDWCTDDVWGRAPIQLACPTAKALRRRCGNKTAILGEAPEYSRQWTVIMQRGNPRRSLRAQSLWKWCRLSRPACALAPSASLKSTI